MNVAQGIFLILLGGAVYVGGNIVTDSYRERHAEEVVAKVQNDPAVLNAQLAQTERETEELCLLQRTKKECDKLLNEAPTN